MENQSRTRRAAGFTLIELLVVMAIILIAALIGFPALQNMIQRSKLEGFARQTAILMQRARYEAIRINRPVVVQFDETNGRVFAFADLNSADPVDPTSSDLIFNPVSSAAYRTTDYELGHALLLPGKVKFGAPGVQPEVFGFTADPDGGPNIVVFDPNGSVRDVGAIRFTDAKEANFLEVNVEPQATARVEVRKWNDEEGKFLAPGDDNKRWEWQ
jgi:prepilin-type N-terminal cleavage/methylation domain-containing protein